MSEKHKGYVWQAVVCPTNGRSLPAVLISVTGKPGREEMRFSLGAALIDRTKMKAGDKVSLYADPAARAVKLVVEDTVSARKVVRDGKGNRLVVKFSRKPFTKILPAQMSSRASHLVATGAGWLICDLPTDTASKTKEGK